MNKLNVYLNLLKHLRLYFNLKLLNLMIYYNQELKYHFQTTSFFCSIIIQQNF